MQRVLIITYYWPPSGGAGVQRWLKFAKYLRAFGWEPVIYTPSNPGFALRDESLLRDIPEGLEVLKRPIWEPYSAYSKFAGGTKSTVSKPAYSPGGSRKLLNRISLWVRGNLFIPDARRFWINPSCRFLTRYVQEHPVDAIVSTGPPHSMHLIARHLHKKLNIPWLADFRDPWTTMDYYKAMNIGAWADRKHHRLEREIVTQCSALVVVGRDMKENYEKLGAKNVHVITNGFDPDDLAVMPTEGPTKFSISHIGTLPPAFNLKGLWQVLAELSDEIPGFRQALEIKLIGQADALVVNDIRKAGLAEPFKAVEYLPHEEATMQMKHSAILLLALNQESPNVKGIITGKFFEYLASGRPILAIGPTDGDLAHILKETQAGEIARYDDLAGLKRIIKGQYNLFLKGTLPINSQGIEKYTRKSLTERIAAVLCEISTGR